MTCEEFVRGLSDYIDGGLAPALRLAVDEHLASCHGCHVVLDTTQCAILLSRTARATALSPERRDALLRRLESACKGCGSKGAIPAP